MTMPHPPDEQTPIRRFHVRAKRYVEEWLDFPAHVHQVAYHMKNPPEDRPRSRQEFLGILRALAIPEAQCAVAEKFGYGARVLERGDRLVIVWEAHTEYYNYVIWHIPDDKTVPLEFGPLRIPGFQFPPALPGVLISSLDLIFSPERRIAPELVRALLPGPHVYGSRVFGEEIAVVTSFTPDEELRERYLIFSSDPKALLGHLDQVTDAVVTMENYYHLLLLPYPEFSKAVDRIHALERHHLRQRETLTAQLAAADSATLQSWLTRLTQDFLEVSRFAESMRYQLSASEPYNDIVHATVRSLQERSVPPWLPLSDFVLGGISGAAAGYQQLLRRIEAVEADFQSLISVIRTRVNLMQQEQSLVLEQQNFQMLANVDKTTRSQAILQHTVEGLSIIVIAYYLTGLFGYAVKAAEELGWIANAAVATGLFVPVSLGLSFLLIYFGRKVIYKLMASGKDR
ncbi:MAG: DUF3422 family protein [Nitrospirota bacterium]